MDNIILTPIEKRRQTILRKREIKQLKTLSKQNEDLKEKLIQLKQEHLKYKLEQKQRVKDNYIKKKNLIKEQKNIKNETKLIDLKVFENNKEQIKQVIELLDKYKINEDNVEILKIRHEARMPVNLN